MVIGIVTEIAIFYFSEFRELAETGHPDPVVEAGVNRFRPIAMTTIAAVLATAIKSGLRPGTGNAQTAGNRYHFGAGRSNSPNPLGDANSV